MMLNFGWEEGVIGKFAQLNKWAQDNRQLAQDLADDGSAGLITRIVASATLQLRDLASGSSPVDTGTLRSSHRGDVDPYMGGVQGTIYIDPYARNPVSDSKPSYYGEIWANKYFNWFEHTADIHGETILDGMEQKLISRIDDLWR